MNKLNTTLLTVSQSSFTFGWIAPKRTPQQCGTKLPVSCLDIFTSCDPCGVEAWLSWVSRALRGRYIGLRGQPMSEIVKKHRHHHRMLWTGGRELEERNWKGGGIFCLLNQTKNQKKERKWERRKTTEFNKSKHTIGRVSRKWDRKSFYGRTTRGLWEREKQGPENVQYLKERRELDKRAESKNLSVRTACR